MIALAMSSGDISEQVGRKYFQVFNGVRNIRPIVKMPLGAGKFVPVIPFVPVGSGLRL